MYEPTNTKLLIMIFLFVYDIISFTQQKMLATPLCPHVHSSRPFHPHRVDDRPRRTPRPARRPDRTAAGHVLVVPPLVPPPRPPAVLEERQDVRGGRPGAAVRAVRDRQHVVRRPRLAVVHPSQLGAGAERRGAQRRHTHPKWDVTPEMRLQYSI